MSNDFDIEKTGFTTELRESGNAQGADFRKVGAFLFVGLLALSVGGYFFMTRTDEADSTAQSGDFSQPSPVASEPLVTEQAPAAPPAPAFQPIISFAYDSYSLNGESEATLMTWVKKMSEDKSLTITLEGHCDERGTRAYNLALGNRRAVAARAFMVNNGISTRRIKIKSFGEDRPIVAGQGESSWSQNRRVEFVTATGRLTAQN